jgi:hypothetical protein
MAAGGAGRGGAGTNDQTRPDLAALVPRSTLRRGLGGDAVAG